MTGEKLDVDFSVWFRESYLERIGFRRARHYKKELETDIIGDDNIFIFDRGETEILLLYALSDGSYMPLKYYDLDNPERDKNLLNNQLLVRLGLVPDVREVKIEQVVLE